MAQRKIFTTGNHKLHIAQKTIFDRVLFFVSQRTRLLDNEPNAAKLGTNCAAGLSSPMTRRGLEIVRLAALGFGDKEISSQLGISHHTVESHWKRLRGKYLSSNRTAVVAAVLLSGFNIERSFLRTEIQRCAERIAELETELKELRGK